MASVTYSVKAPDGKIIKVSGPAGASEAEVMAQAKKLYSPAAPAQPSREALRIREMAAKERSVKEQAELAKEFNPTNDMSAFERTAAGAGKSVVDTWRGLKQLYNMTPLGSEEELARLHAEQEEVDKRDAPLMDTTAGTVGNIGGAVATSILPAGLAAKASVIPRAGSAAMTTLRTLLGGAAGGAAGGAITPLTATEEAQGERAANTAIGAGLGTAGSAVVPVIKGLAATRKTLPDDMARDVVSRMLGHSPEAPGQSTEQFQNAVRDYLGATRSASNARYSAALGTPGTTPVTLTNTSNLTSDFADTLVDTRYPIVNKVRQALVNNSTSPAGSILGPNGRPLVQSGPRAMPIEDVHQAKNELMMMAREAPFQSPRQNALYQQANALRSDIDLWGAAPQNAAGKKALDEAGALYRAEVAPLLTRDTPIGRVVGGKGATFPASGLRQTLRSGEGAAVKEIAKKVPGTADAMRAMLGARLADATTDGQLMKALTNDDVAASLLSAEELTYRNTLARALREMKDGTSFMDTLGVKIPVVGNSIKKALHGVRPMGYTGQSPRAADLEALYMGMLPGLSFTATE